LILLNLKFKDEGIYQKVYMAVLSKWKTNVKHTA